MPTILLLIASNVFMTTAWYWHLSSHRFALWIIMRMSWLIALPEHALVVPAKRIGHISNGGPFTAPQLKILQEGIALMVFLAFSIMYLKEMPRWTDFAGMGLIMAGLAAALLGRGA